MAKHLISTEEARALSDLLHRNEFSDNLDFDHKDLGQGNIPFRFKLLESMQATVLTKAYAAIYLFGGTTDDKIDTAYVTDDSSKYFNASSGDKGVCFATSEYFIAFMYSTVTEYIGKAITSYASTDATIVINFLEPMDGVGPAASSSVTLNVNNRFKWNVINNGEVLAKYNQYSSQFEATQTECT